MRLINRICAYLLGVLITLYLITGYIIRSPIKFERIFPVLNITRLAVNLHLDWLDLVLIPLFLFHCLTSLRMIIIKKDAKRFRGIDLVFIAIGFILLAAFLYFRF
jgi:hypothetical protein